MTASPDTMPHLLPCPHCSAAITQDGAWARHPKADCLYGDQILFTWRVPALVRRWNMRSWAPADLVTANQMLIGQVKALQDRLAAISDTPSTKPSTKETDMKPDLPSTATAIPADGGFHPIVLPGMDLNGAGRAALELAWNLAKAEAYRKDGNEKDHETYMGYANHWLREAADKTGYQLVAKAA